MKASEFDSKKRMRLGIYARALTLVGVILTVATAGVTGWNIQDKRKILTVELERRIEALASHQAAAVANALWDLNRSGANSILHGLSQDPDFVTVRVTDDVGRTFAEFAIKTVPEELALRTSHDIVLENTGSQMVIGSLSLTLSRERLIAAQRQAAVDALILGAILLAVMMLAISLVLRMVTNPLAEISARMLSVAAGDLKSHIPHADRADQIGRVARAVETFREVSDERQLAQTSLEEAHDEMEQRVEQRTDDLRRTEALFSRTFHVSPGLFAISRPEDGAHYKVNRTWMETTGYSHEEAMAHSAQDLGIWVETNDRERFVARLESEGSVQNFEAKFRTKDGREIDVLVNGEHMEIGGEPHLLVVSHDVTEHKLSEEHLRQAQKMEAVGQLTGGVAHDFNNLLAVIIGNAELLEDRLGHEVSELSAISQTATRGADLTQRLLAFSRRQPLRPKVIDVGGLVSGMSELLARTLGETIEIQTFVATDLQSALADPGQVENALLNLALNARDAMPNGGKLTIECQNARLGADYVDKHPDLIAGNYVVLAVSDEGTGMSAEVKSHAFEPFFTTKEVGEGSGLGLSMIYGFAKQSGGHATIYSEVGKGTTVKLYLPRGEQAQQVIQAGKVQDIPRGEGETILVIEDDPEVRALAVRMLESLNYRVIDVADAASAHKALATEETFDLVLSDVVLTGGTSGPEFAEKARMTYPDLKIIFMSGYPAEAAHRNGFLGSNYVLLNKPFRRLEFAKAIRDAVK